MQLLAGSRITTVAASAVARVFAVLPRLAGTALGTATIDIGLAGVLKAVAAYVGNDTWATLLTPAVEAFLATVHDTVGTVVTLTQSRRARAVGTIQVSAARHTDNAFGAVAAPAVDIGLAAIAESVSAEARTRTIEIVVRGGASAHQHEQG